MSNSFESTYPKGHRVACVVTRVESFGVFVRLADAPEVFGFIRPRDWSWSRRLFDITAQIEPGEEIEAEVVGYGQNRKLELSRRRTLPDPFPEFARRHRVGDPVLGQVSLLGQNEAGVMLALDEGVEGFIPRGEIPDVAEEGFGLLEQDWVAARILYYRREQVRLSIREHLRARQLEDDAGDDSQTALRFHPDLGPSLENMRLNLELAELEEPALEPEVRRRVRRVLLVEDSSNVSESLEMVFTHFGFSCDAASSIDRALELLAQESYDLLVLDVNLPAGKRKARGEEGPRDERAFEGRAADGGVELVRRLGAEATEAIVFVLTATAAGHWDEVIQNAPNATTCFFQKPTRVAHLFTQLNRLVKGEPAEDDRSFTAGLDPRGSPEVRAHDARHRDTRQKIETALAELVADTRASLAFVLSFRPGPTWGLLAVAGGLPFPELGREVQQELDISPVGDVIRQRRHLAVADVREQEKRFKHLTRVIPLGSFAGLPLNYADQSEYGLFLIGERPRQLRRIDEARLRTTALLVGHYIAEERLDQVITENQSLLLTGFLSDSLLHEIKNELQALSDYSEIQAFLGKKHAGNLNQLGGGEERELKRSILGIQAVSKRLSELVVLFRNLAGHPGDETVDLNAAVARLLATLEPFAAARDVSLESDLDPILPVLRASPKLIDQSILNLMINGVEQMSRLPGIRRKLTVTTRFRRDGEFPIEILVADTGRGVHWVHREKIFDLFFTTKERGTGLGLYLSRFFIEQLGGRLTLRSSVMFSGAEFAIELPRRVLGS